MPIDKPFPVKLITEIVKFRNTGEGRCWKIYKIALTLALPI